LREATWTSSNEALALARELGTRIRSYRTDAGLTISELSARTRIAARYLNSLEDGSLKELPEPVFVKGFIRSVCSELGKEPGPLIELVGQFHNEEPAEEAETPNGSKRTAPLILSAILLSALVIGGILLHGRDDGTGSQNPQAVQDPSVLQEKPLIKGDEIAREVPIVELDLLLRATDKTWLRIQADFSKPWETTMKAGDEIRLKAVDKVELFIGNAGGILFELNGKRFGPLGTPGQVIPNYVITKDNL